MNEWELWLFYGGKMPTLGAKWPEVAIPNEIYHQAALEDAERLLSGS